MLTLSLRTQVLASHSLAEQRQGIFLGTQKWAQKCSQHLYQPRDAIGRRNQCIGYSCFRDSFTGPSTSSILLWDTIEKWKTSFLCRERNQRHCRSFIKIEILLGTHFRLVTGQKSVVSCLILDMKKSRTTKFRGGESNDRATVLALFTDRVVTMWLPMHYPEAFARRSHLLNHWKNHNSLCHPGVVRMP